MKASVPAVRAVASATGVGKAVHQRSRPSFDATWDHDNERQMVKHGKLMDRILRGASDANIPFDDLRSLLLRLGLAERMRGSHHIFRRAGVEEKVNLQREGNRAKPYQVKQVRAVILRYRLAEEE